MVCDEDFAICQLVGALAEGIGFQVLAQVTSELDLSASIQAVSPDVLVLDLVGLGMSGLERLPELRSQLPDRAIIVFTGFEDLDEKAVRGGASLVIQKPRVDLLESALHRLHHEMVSGG